MKGHWEQDHLMTDPSPLVLRGPHRKFSMDERSMRDSAGERQKQGRDVGPTHP